MNIPTRPNKCISSFSNFLVKLLFFIKMVDMEILSTASSRRSSFNDFRLQLVQPFQRLPTVGDGNCLIHAFFGNRQVSSDVFHPRADGIRREMAQKIREHWNGNTEELWCIDQTGLNRSEINTNDLANSLAENGEFLGLEHADLIAKLFKINVRIYYPKGNTYESLELFHKENGIQEVDRIIFFNGRNHWEKCALDNEPRLPSSLAFTDPRFNPKYKRIFENNANYSPSERIKVNTRAIVVLKCENHHRMKKSYLFKFCRPQEYNERFLNTFADFFQHLRGSEPLAMSAGYALANKFRGYKDVCVTDCSFNHSDYVSAYDYTYSPTPEVIQELKQIIEEEHGLKDFFFETLQRNHFRISEEYKLENRDTWLREFPVFPRVYPRCADVLKDVFTDLLSEKWLEKDINGLKYYLNQNTPIERPLDIGKLLEAKRVWKIVKQAVEAKINHDEKLNKHFYDELKKDIKNLGISSMVSLVPGCGAAFLGGVGRTVINTLGNYSDPEGKKTSIQMMKLLGGSGLGKLMGGDVFELGTSMGIDLVEFYVRDEKTTKNEGTALSVYTSVLKGLCTGDKQKLIAQVLGTCVAEGAERVDEKDAPLDVKILLTLLKNPDTRGLIVNDLVNEFSKEKPPEVPIAPELVEQPTPEEQELYPKQIITEVENEHVIKEPEMHDPEGYKNLLLEEGLIKNALETEKAKLVDPNYSKFGTPQDTRIQKQAGFETANDKHEEKFAKFEKACRYGKASKEEASWKSAEKNLKNARGEVATIETYIGQTTNKIAELNGKIAENQKAQADASAPKHINAPDPKVHIIGDQKTGENHHSYYVENGQKQGLGKYGNAEDARYISGLFTTVETNKLSLEMQCFDAQRQLVEAGFSIDDIPKRPTLSMPTILGNDVDANSRTLNTAGVNNKKVVQSYLKGLETLLGKPIETQGLSNSEITQITSQVNPNIKDPKEHGFWYNAYRAPGKGLRTGLQWLDDHGVSLSVNVDINRPLYKTKAPQSSYSDTQHQIAIQSPQLPSIDQPSQHRPSIGTWENVEAMQANQIFERNMAFKSPPTPSQPLDFGNGVASNVQMPPNDWNGLGRNEVVSYQSPQKNMPIKMAGVLPFVLTKVVPEQTQRKVETWVKGFIQQWKDDPIKARKDMDLCLILGAKTAVVIAIQAFEQPSLKTRPNSFRLMEASDKFDNWFAGKANIDLTSPNAQMSMFVGEFAMPLPMVGAFKHCTKVGQEGIAFIKQANKLLRPQPLMDRAFAFPQGFSKEVRAIEAMQNPVYRSGFVHNKAVEQARKAVNLPAWKKMTIDMKHTVSGHIEGGWRTGCKGHKKTLFPDGFSEKQVEKIIRQAYRNGKKVKTQGERVVVIGEYEGIEIQMHVNIKEKIIETAYPKK
jgi:hypothetical protein